MAETMFDMLDEYVIDNIFKILYESYDLKAIVSFQLISNRCYKIGDKYESYLSDDDDEKTLWNGKLYL